MFQIVISWYEQIYPVFGKIALSLILFSVTFLMLFIVYDRVVSLTNRLEIASSVSGKILFKGKPLSNYSILRESSWALMGKNYTDTVSTDTEGNFTFLAITEKKPFRANFPHETVLRQRFFVEVDGQREEIVVINKSDYYPNRGNEIRIKPLTGFEVAVGIADSA
jgi:hypothetical protein